MSAYFSPSRTYEWLNPDPIYSAISDASAIMTGLIPLLVGVVFVIRYLQESSKQLTGKAKFNEAAGAITENVILLFLYSLSGWMILEFSLALSAYFYQQGSFSLVAGVFSDLYETLQARTKDYEATLIDSLLDVFVTAGAAPMAFFFFQLTSAALVFFLSFFRIGYALYFGLIFLWGFVAIPTGGLAGALNLSKGWTRSMIALIVWPIIESILLIFMYAFMKGLSKNLETMSGTASMIFVNMHFMMGVVCILLIVVMIAAPFVTARLAMSQEALSGLMKPIVGGAVVTAFYANKIFGASKPSSEGGRRRDRAAAGAKQFNETAVEKMAGAGYRAVKKMAGLGNAVSNSKDANSDKPK